MHHEEQSQPSDLMRTWERLIQPDQVPGPVLDVACGDGRNGIHAARLGLSVICCDRSRTALRQARLASRLQDVRIRLWWTDLEKAHRRPLPEKAFGAVLIFRYLHRPLIPEVHRAIRPGGFIVYETFTVEQTTFGPPCNPDHLLKPGELGEWFQDWQELHRFEGRLTEPDRAMAQIVARKPAT